MVILSLYGEPAEEKQTIWNLKGAADIRWSGLLLPPPLPPPLPPARLQIPLIRTFTERLQTSHFPPQCVNYNAQGVGNKDSSPCCGDLDELGVWSGVGGWLGWGGVSGTLRVGNDGCVSDWLRCVLLSDPQTEPDLAEGH